METSCIYLKELNKSGTCDVVTRSDKINYNLSTILDTPRGSRLCSPEFGSNLYLLKFDLINEVLLDLVRIYTLDAIQVCEPRISVENIQVSTNSNSDNIKLRKTIQIHITYRISGSNELNNYTHNFTTEGV